MTQTAVITFDKVGNYSGSAFLSGVNYTTNNTITIIDRLTFDINDSWIANAMER